MNTPNPSDTQTDLSRVLEQITEITNASTEGDDIYRGEPECKDIILKILVLTVNTYEFTKHVDKIYGFKVEFKIGNTFLAREHIH